MSRVTVTGGSGFVGSHLVERLVAQGDEVTVFDSTAPPEHRRASGVRYVEGDIRDAAVLATAITPGTEIVYHMAAVVGVDLYISRPLDVIDINFSGTRNVLEAIAKVGAKAVVASTSEIFGKNPDVPWREDGDRVLGPTSADRWTYSSSKALTEHLTYAFARQHGLEATIVRYFNVYGPRQRPAYIVSRTIHRALNGLAPVVYDQGLQTRCFTYMDDAIDGTLRAAASPKAAGEAFNLGSMVETTIGEVVDLIAELTGFGSATVAANPRDKFGTAYEDLLRRVPDTTKAQTVLDWKCQVGLRDGLTKTIEWARQNPWWLALPDSGAS